MGTILVNATALRSGGGLSILNQFIDNIPLGLDEYYIFVSPNCNFSDEKRNVHYVFVKTERWIDRLKWDHGGLLRWVRKNNLQVNVVVSLQNTGVKFDKQIPQIIYFHNLLTISNYKWCFFNKEERTYFYYQNIYPYFISKYLSNNTHVVVQTGTVAKSFSEKFKISPSRIHVIRPDVNTGNYASLDNSQVSDNDFHFIYPAVPLIYKNHQILISALSKIKSEDVNLFNKVYLHFTFRKEDCLRIVNCIKKNGLENNIVYDGVIPHGELLVLYKSMKAMLFPSYIETFGLPLLEAAATGIPILVSDVSYAHDVMDTYEGANFISYNDSESWKNEIIKKCKEKTLYKPLYQSHESNWNRFFELINILS